MHACMLEKGCYSTKIKSAIYGSLFVDLCFLLDSVIITLGPPSLLESMFTTTTHMKTQWMLDAMHLHGGHWMRTLLSEHTCKKLDTRLDSLASIKNFCIFRFYAIRHIIYQVERSNNYRQISQQLWTASIRCWAWSHSSRLEHVVRSHWEQVSCYCLL